MALKRSCSHDREFNWVWSLGRWDFDGCALKERSRPSEGAAGNWIHQGGQLTFASCRFLFVHIMSFVAYARTANFESFGLMILVNEEIGRLGLHALGARAASNARLDPSCAARLSWHHRDDNNAPPVARIPNHWDHRGRAELSPFALHLPFCP